MQKAYYPMEVINITQGYGSNSYSHQYSYALDLGGKDSGKDKIYAPFDCVVTKVYAKAGRSFEVWLESLEEIICPNGYVGYLTVSLTHPSEIKYMKVGQKFKQWEYICNEGKEGADANHVHIEVSRGRNCSGWDIIKKGNKTHYVNKNRVIPEEYLCVKKGCIIKNDVYRGRKYKLIREEDIVYDNDRSLGVYETLEEMYVRGDAGSNAKILKVRDLTIDGRKNATSKDLNAPAIYKKGTRFNVYEIIDNNGIWGRSPSGWICLRGKRVYCRKL